MTHTKSVEKSMVPVHQNAQIFGIFKIVHGFHRHAADRVHDPVRNDRRGPFEISNFSHHLRGVVGDK